MKQTFNAKTGNNKNKAIKELIGNNLFSKLNKSKLNQYRRISYNNWSSITRRMQSLSQLTTNNKVLNKRLQKLTNNVLQEKQQEK